jgi:MYXO-CTERM domain-containing protein
VRAERRNAPQIEALDEKAAEIAMHRYALTGFLVTALASCVAPAAHATIELPVIAWDPGVPGGIPDVTSPVVSVREHGAVADGKTDDLHAFQEALAALTNGGVLLVPAGDYYLGGTLTIGTDGLVIRGEGAGRTRLLLGPAVTASIDVVTYGRGDWQTLAAAPKRGTTTLTVPDGSKFSVGKWAEIQAANDASLMYTDLAWNVDWAANARGQLFEVAAVSGNQLTLRHPVYLDYAAADTPQIRPQRFVQHVGIERLYLERVTNDSDVSTIQFKNAAYVWIREVESNQTRRAHVATESVIGCEVENNYLHHSYDYGGSGHGYGIQLGLHTSDCLVENNVFYHLRHSMLIQLGASGNVFGYNHSDATTQTEGSVPNEGWLPPDISIHGHFANNDLYESNTVQQVGIADYWGPTGPHMAFLRNRVVNGEVRSDGQPESGAISLDDHSNYQYLIGNVIEQGTLGTDGTCDMSTNVIHGDVQGGAPVWDADHADHALPVSYYLQCKPNFLGDKPWPLVGPDVTAKVALAATDRFVAGAPIAPTYVRACADGSAGWVSGAGGATGIRSTTNGGVTGTGAAATSAAGTGVAPGKSASGSDSGCSCHAARSAPGGLWPMLGAALALVLRRRRCAPRTARPQF